ncbi:hypothetical protein CC80DRAFT_545151 [Byssothecium circinans]|uniref:Uncharacterized protein n=1 Tax=Byssothecium circinans TaxID=147558 RepID=A0A6A5U5V8_9PLEO|nr:hypothetical protein CC80DRAFT_545151 [Byssothecium circinans]
MAMRTTTCRHWRGSRGWSSCDLLNKLPEELLYCIFQYFAPRPLPTETDKPPTSLDRANLQIQRIALPLLYRNIPLYHITGPNLEIPVPKNGSRLIRTLSERSILGTYVRSFNLADAVRSYSELTEEDVKKACNETRAIGWTRSMDTYRAYINNTSEEGRIVRRLVFRDDVDILSVYVGRILKLMPGLEMVNLGPMWRFGNPQNLLNYLIDMAHPDLSQVAARTFNNNLRVLRSTTGQNLLALYPILSL